MAPTLRKRRRLPTQTTPPINPPSSHHDCPDKAKADTQAEARDKRVVRFHPVDQARDNGPDVYQLPHITTKPRDTLLTNIKLSTLATNAAAVESTDTTASPIDAIQSDLDMASTQMSMPSTSMTRPRPDLPDLDLDIEQLELNRASTSQVPGGDFLELQSVQLQAGHHCLESLRGHNTALESGIQQECDPALIQPCRSERGVAVWRRYGLSKIMSRCLLVDRGVTHEERLRYIFGPSVGSKGPPVHGPRRVVPDGQGGFKYADSAKSKIQTGALVLKRHHFIQSSNMVSNEFDEEHDEGQDKDHSLKEEEGHHFIQSPNMVNNEFDEEHDEGQDKDHPLKEEEGSLLHSLYLQVLASGIDGTSAEEIFTNLHCQSATIMLKDDWEDKVTFYLNHNPYFGQTVKGHYCLTKFLDSASSKRSSKANSKELQCSKIDYNQGSGGRRKKKR